MTRGILDEIDDRMQKEFEIQNRKEIEEHDSHSLFWAKYYDEGIWNNYEDMEERRKFRENEDNKTIIIDKEKKKKEEEKPKLRRNRLYRVPLTYDEVCIRIEEWLDVNKMEIENIKNKSIPEDLRKITEIKKEKREIID